MNYQLEFSDKAKKDLIKLKKGDAIAYKKVEKLLHELMIHPTTGTGKPEQLRYGLSGYWSRRIDKKNRLIYRIEEEKITVIVVSNGALLIYSGNKERMLRGVCVF